MSEKTLEDHSNLLRRLRSRPSPARSSYSASSTAKVKPVLDRLLDGRNDILVTAEETGYTVNTLYVKLVDGLKFLVDNSEEYGSVYAELRSQISMRKTDTGVLIYFKDTVRNLIKEKELKYDYADSSVWRGELLTWLQTAQDMETWKRDNLVLKEEDLRWLEEQQKTIDFEFDTAQDRLAVIR